MTRLLYYCHIMRKWLSYILMAAFIVSIFDILDVSDIKLGNREVFSTENVHADNDYDDLSDYGFRYAGVSAFEVKACHYELVFDVVSTGQPQQLRKINLAYSFSPGNLHRPPIV